MAVPHIGVILSSIREGRFADKPLAWLLEKVEGRTDSTYDVVDLRDYPLPFFAEAKPPAMQPPNNDVALRWAKKLDEFDGYIVITAEYNHAPTGVIKNAMDYAFSEFAYKPIAFIGYGGVGAARAIEQLRMIAIELYMIPVRNSVNIATAEYLAAREGRSFDEFPYLLRALESVLHDVTLLANAMVPVRKPDAGKIVQKE